MTEEHDYFSLPLYVRENSLIPTRPEPAGDKEPLFEEITLNLYEIRESTEAVFFEGEPIRVSVEKKNGELLIRWDGKLSATRIRIPSAGYEISLSAEQRQFVIPDPFPAG